MSETNGEGGLVGELTDASEQPVTVFLVWNIIGTDQVQIFSIPPGQRSLQVMAIESHNLYINGDEIDDDHLIFTLNDMIDRNNPAIMEFCIYDSANTELNTVPVLPGSVNATEIVVCGFFC